MMAGGWLLRSQASQSSVPENISPCWLKTSLLRVRIPATTLPALPAIGFLSGAPGRHFPRTEVRETCSAEYLVNHSNCDLEKRKFYAPPYAVRTACRRVLLIVGGCCQAVMFCYIVGGQCSTVEISVVRCWVLRRSWVWMLFDCGGLLVVSL